MSDSKRIKLYKEQDGKCFYCCKPFPDSKKKYGTIDHVIPKSRGGSNSIKNCVLVCKYCNQLKADFVSNQEVFDHFSKVFYTVSVAERAMRAGVKGKIKTGLKKIKSR